jgi:hypothetical protein
MPRHAVAAQAHLAALTTETRRPIFANVAKSAPANVTTNVGGAPANQHPMVASQAKDVKAAIQPPPTATGHTPSGVTSTGTEKWEENDYMVNVIYEK